MDGILIWLAMVQAIALQRVVADIAVEIGTEAARFTDMAARARFFIACKRKIVDHAVAAGLPLAEAIEIAHGVAMGAAKITSALLASGSSTQTGSA